MLAGEFQTLHLPVILKLYSLFPTPRVPAAGASKHARWYFVMSLRGADRLQTIESISVCEQVVQAADAFVSKQLDDL